MNKGQVFLGTILFQTLSTISSFSMDYEKYIHDLYNNFKLTIVDARNLEKCEYFRSAIDRYKEALNHNGPIPEKSNVCLDIGDIYKKMDKIDDALYWYNEALNYCPDNHNAYACISSIYFQDKNQLMAMKVYDDGLKNCPEQQLFFIKLIENYLNDHTLFGLGNDEYVLDFCKEKIKKFPTHQIFYIELNSYYSENRYFEGVKIFSDILINHKSIYAFYFFNEMLLKLNRYTNIKKGVDIYLETLRNLEKINEIKFSWDKNLDQKASEYSISINKNHKIILLKIKLFEKLNKIKKEIGEKQYNLLPNIKSYHDAIQKLKEAKKEDTNTILKWCIESMSKNPHPDECAKICIVLASYYESFEKDDKTALEINQWATFISSENTHSFKNIAFIYKKKKQFNLALTYYEIANSFYDNENTDLLNLIQDTKSKVFENEQINNEKINHEEIKNSYSIYLKNKESANKDKKRIRNEYDDNEYIEYIKNKKKKIEITEDDLINEYFSEAKRCRLENNFKEEIRFYEKIISILKNPKKLSSVYLKMGLARLSCTQSKDDPSNAENCFIKAIELDPKNGQAYLEMGKYCEKYKGKDADVWYEKGLKNNPDDEKLNFAFGNYYYHIQKNTEKALPYFKKTIMLSQSDYSYISDKSHEYFHKTEKIFEGFNFFVDIFQQKKTTKNLLFIKNFFYQILKMDHYKSNTIDDLKRSIKSINQIVDERAISGDNDASEYYGCMEKIRLMLNHKIDLGSSKTKYSSQESYDKAEKSQETSDKLYWYIEALKQNFSYVSYKEICTKIGDCYRHQKKNDLALDYYNKALDVDPSISGAYKGKGLIYHRVDKDFEKSLEMFLKALSLRKDDAQTYEALGDLYCQLRYDNLIKENNVDEAEKAFSDGVEWYKEGVKNRPLYKTNYDRVRSSLVRKKLFSDALKFFKEIYNEGKGNTYALTVFNEICWDIVKYGKKRVIIHLFLKL